MKNFLGTICALLLSSPVAATTLVYTSDSLIDLEYASRVVTGINFTDPRTEAEQGFSRANDVTLHVTFDNDLAANTSYSDSGFGTDETLTGLSYELIADGNTSTPGFSPGFVTNFTFTTDVNGDLQTWLFSYFFGGGDFLSVDLTHTGDTVQSQIEKAFSDGSGGVLCCTGYSDPVGGSFAAGTWSSPSAVPLPASLPLLLAGFSGLYGIRRYKRA